MSLLFIFTPLTLVAAIFERPRKVRVYRKRTVHSFELEPGAMGA